MALLDLGDDERRLMGASECDEAAIVLRGYAVYIDRVYARQLAAVRYLRVRHPGSPEELAAAIKLDAIGQLIPRVGDLARSFEGLAHTKRRMMT